MTNVSLEHVYQVEGYFPKLHDLSLQNCSVQDIHTALHPFLVTNKNNIYSVSVNYNDVTDVQGNAFQSLVTLQTLDLCHNKISSIDRNAFINSSNLWMLKLCSNRLEKLDQFVFSTNAKITSLYLQNNAFQDIPIASLINLQNLQLLDLSSNYINKVPSLKIFSRLKFLYLSNNRITTVESNAFDELHHLSVLLLSGNKITSLPEDMAVLFNLMDFTRITLNENPLACTCTNRWLITWLQKKCSVYNNAKGCTLTCSENKTNFLITEFEINRLTCGCFSQCFCQHETLCTVNCYNSNKQVQTLECLSCPAGSSPLFDGSSTCVCHPGYSDQKDEGVCEKCPRGTFKSLIGDKGCTPCPEYSTSEAGSTTVDQCECQHGEFQIFSEQSRKCQRFENEELMRFDMEPTATFTPMKHDQVTPYKNSPDKPDSMVYGIVGTVLTLVIIGVGLALLKWKQIQKSNHGITQRLMCQESHQNEERHGSLVYSTKLENYYKGLEVASSQLRIGKMIGRGAFGRVYEGYLQYTKDKDIRKVAVKRLKEDANSEEKDALQMELDQMMYVGKHPNIIELIGVCSMKGTLMLVLEFASNGDLLSYLRQCSALPDIQLNAPRFGNDSTAMEIFRKLTMYAWHVAKGMCHLEKLKCIHRDLAARNVLLTADPIAKISDFGLSRDVYESAYYFKVSKGRLPFKWMSPEALLMGQYSIKSDVWSFGILLWEVVTLGGNPYAGIPVECLCEMYSNNYRLPKPASCPNYLYKLMLECWGELTNERPSFNEVEARLDAILQQVANRDYTNLMETDELPESHSVIDCATESKGSNTTSTEYDTDSSDRTFHETSDSDSSKEPDQKSDLLNYHQQRNHQPQRTTKNYAKEDCSPLSSPRGKETLCPLVKSLSSMELQNLSNYKVHMLSNPIYGSTRKAKETE
uniref:Receptor tyrosine-protein kinase erbB-4-like n=1 Tax=Crassostrea virginica TaxID=6565 RepID=A0A8B8BBY9_CRAVI|nr:receptor tyrosine-protein kinase erbB-4-like [Crassostrea virginica]